MRIAIVEELIMAVDMLKGIGADEAAVAVAKASDVLTILSSVDHASLTAALDQAACPSAEIVADVLHGADREGNPCAYIKAFEHRHRARRVQPG